MNNVLILLNYNDFETTKTFLTNVKDITIIEKVIVVDNCSTDNSFEMLKSYESTKIDIIKTDNNGGYSSGNNYGALYAIKKYNPQYIFIANPDIELNTEALVGIGNFYENNKNAGIVSCKMITSSDIDIMSAWRLPTYSDFIWDNLMILKKIFGIKKINYNKEHFDKKCSIVDVVNGSFFAIPAKVFIEVELFDEDTFLYGEENILAFKLKEKGYTNYLLNDYTYIHNHSVSISKSIKSIGKRLDLAYDARCIYLDKYLKVSTLRRIINTVTYKIGKVNYLILSKIFKRTKRI